jgi:hypothetical protein
MKFVLGFTLLFSIFNLLNDEQLFSKKQSTKEKMSASKALITKPRKARFRKISHRIVIFKFTT